MSNSTTTHSVGGLPVPSSELIGFKGGEFPQPLSSLSMAPSDAFFLSLSSTLKSFFVFMARADPAGRSSGTRSLLDELAENSAQMRLIWPIEIVTIGSIEKEELFEDMDEDIIWIC